MRELFADEMHAQRELHERVASAHLADFQDQFHTQTISTVSFALAQLPLQAPDATGKVARSHQTMPPPQGRRRNTGPAPAVLHRTTGQSPVIQSRSTGQSLAIKPSPAIDTMAPPTAALEPVTPVTGDQIADLIEPADTALGMAGAVPERGPGRRRRVLVISASAATVLLVAFGLRGLATSGGGTNPQGGSRIASATDPRAVTVEPAPVDSQATARSPDKVVAVVAKVPDEIEMMPDDPAPAPSAVAPPNLHVPRRPVRKDPRPPAAPPPASFTREQLGQKFQQVRREYDEYKTKFGSRLENEWVELATYIQFMPASDDDAGRKEAARRLDAFRVRMRE
jgi:hypothetical protein